MSIHSTPTDLMDYVNFYNYQTEIYSTKLYNSYQKLYNMQLEQLAYRYACNAKISILNVKLPQTTGMEGFQQAVIALNTQYNNNYTKIESAINDTLALIDSSQLVSIINTNFFKSVSPLLESTTFSNNLTKVGQCSLTSFKFNPESTSTNMQYGSIQLSALCLTESSAKHTTWQTESQDIPYYQENNKIARYAFNNIHYDIARHQFIADHNTNTNTKFTTADITYFKNLTTQISANNGINSTPDLELATGKNVFDQYELVQTLFRLWNGSTVKMDNSIYLYPILYANRDTCEGVQGGSCLPDELWGGTSNGAVVVGFGGSITKNLILSQIPNHTQTTLTSLKQAVLASQNGHVFVTNFNLSASHTQDGKQKFNIACLHNSDCSQTTQKLTWSDGSSVSVTGSLDGNGAGTWKISAESALLNDLNMVRYNFVAPSDYNDWLNNNTFENKIYLDGRKTITKPVNNDLVILSKEFTHFGQMVRNKYHVVLALNSNGDLILRDDSNGRYFKQKALQSNINKITFVDGDMRAFDDNNKLIWSISGDYASRHPTSTWLNDPFAAISLDDTGNLVATTSDHSGNFGNSNGVFWSTKGE